MSTIIVFIDSKTIEVDGEFLELEEVNDEISRFDTLVTSNSHSAYRVLRWDETEGVYEKADYSASDDAVESDLTPYVSFFNEVKEERRQSIKTRAMEADATDFARHIRNEKLAEIDWWASSDLTMTAEQTAYRQALRDLPTDSANWNPAWEWDNDAWDVTLIGVTWPTKPE